jgi:YfiR/HmsC-like
MALLNPQRRGAVALAALLLLLPGAQSGAGTEHPPERYIEEEVKAAFLFHFVRFVEWPQEFAPGPDSTIVLGVLGDDPMADVLERTIAGKRIDGRALTLRRFAGPAAVRPCHVLFLPTGRAPDLPRVLQELHGAPVLIVGDSPGFARAGGVINFFLEDDRVRFEINLAAAARAGLRISSKLLTLARVVDRGPAGGGA